VWGKGGIRAYSHACSYRGMQTLARNSSGPATKAEECRVSVSVYVSVGLSIDLSVCVRVCTSACVAAPRILQHKHLARSIAMWHVSGPDTDFQRCIPSRSSVPPYCIALCRPGVLFFRLCLPLSPLCDAGVKFQLPEYSQNRQSQWAICIGEVAARQQHYRKDRKHLALDKSRGMVPQPP